MNAAALKNLVVAPEIERDADLLAGVLRASDLLVEELGASSGSVTAEWQMAPSGKSERVIELRLSDFTGSVQTRFAPVEFADEWRLKRRLYTLWGDLLQERTRRQLEKLHEVVQQLADE